MSDKKEYNINNCYSCKPCNDRNYSRCDNCTAQCCQDNMGSHKELFNLNDDFNELSEKAMEDLCYTCIKIKNNLRNKYDINIICESNFYNIDECLNFLKLLKEKRDEINKDKEINENNISDIKNMHEEKLNKLKISHQEILTKLKNEYNEIEKKYTNDNLLEENKIKEKEKEKENLTKNLKLFDREKQEIINNYCEKEKIKAELEFNNLKNDINEKYVYYEEKLEYTEDELQLKKQYYDEIKKIKLYSNIPIYNNLIESFKLNKYIN